MAENPIHYSDLFNSDIESGLNKLIAQMGQVKDAYTQALEEIRRKAEQAGIALGSMSSATSGGRTGTAGTASNVEALVSEYEKLTKAIELLTQKMDNLGKGRKKTEKETVDIANAYRTLSDVIEEAGVNLEELIKTEKQKQQVDKNGKVANEALAGSYNQLYAQYNLLKTALNAMSKEQREQAKVMEMQAKSIYDSMKMMQEATGKHTLSVGDYSKALNGLTISANQVIREMPTLANSLQQFIIAISNNIPILIDNMKNMMAVTGSWKAVIGGMVRALFSWQTAIIALLTVLPGIIRKIKEKRKAQEEANKAIQDAISYEGLLKKEMLEQQDALIKRITLLKTLKQIIDETKESDLRHKSALEEVKRIMGESGLTLDEYIKKLGERAVAETKVQQIIANSIKLNDLYQKRTENQAKNAERIAQLNKLIDTYFWNIRSSTNKSYLAVQEKALQKAREELEGYLFSNEIKTLEKRNKELRDELDPSALSFGDKTSGARAKKEFKNAIDQWYQFQEEIIKLTMEGMDKEVALNTLRWQKHRDALNEILKTEELTAEQRLIIQERLNNSYDLELKDREEIEMDYLQKEIDAYADAWAQEIIEAEKARQERYKVAVKGADDRLKIATNEANIEHANVVRRNMAIGQAEVEYWTERIRLAKEMGGKYLEQIDLFESNLAKAQERAEKGTQSNGQSARKREGGLLYKLLFGEAVKEDKPSEQLANYLSTLKTAYNAAFSYMNEWMSVREQMAQTAVDSAQREVDAAKMLYEYELQAMANGYAHNVEYARKEYEEKMALKARETKELEKWQKAQEAIDTAQQISALVTTVANLLSGWSTIPIVGQVLAVASIAAMFGTFIAAKATAAQAAKTKKYGNGMSEYLDYGGSHASGNDIDFGTDRHGNQRKVERGEMIAVINKRNVNKYGVSTLSDIFGSLNNGTFGERYGTAYQNMVMPQVADLSTLEKGVSSLVEQGKRRIITSGGKTIEYYKNIKRTIC